MIKQKSLIMELTEILAMKFKMKVHGLIFEILNSDVTYTLCTNVY